MTKPIILTRHPWPKRDITIFDRYGESSVVHNADIVGAFAVWQASVFWNVTHIASGTSAYDSTPIKKHAHAIAFAVLLHEIPCDWTKPKVTAQDLKSIASYGAATVSETLKNLLARAVKTKSLDVLPFMPESPKSPEVYPFKTPHQIALEYSQLIKSYQDEFQSVFGVPLYRYMNTIDGFNVVRFNEQIIKTPDNESMRDCIVYQYSESAAQMVSKLISVSCAEMRMHIPVYTRYS